MTVRYKTKKRKQMLGSKLLLICLLVVIVFLFKGVWGVYIKARQSGERLEQIRKEHEELTERNIFLEHEVVRLSTDAGVEEEIREQYGLGREGERVFVIVEEDDESATTSQKSFWDYIQFWRE